jgi:hypothetical protein
MAKKNTDVLLTVTTANLNQTNKNSKVVFTDNWGDLETPGDPANYVSKVNKNMNITWTAVETDGTTPVTIKGVAKDGGSVIMKNIKQGDSSNIFTAKIKDDSNTQIGDTESYTITITVNGTDFPIDPRIIVSPPPPTAT